jgi:hypothetical protein
MEAVTTVPHLTFSLFQTSGGTDVFRTFNLFVTTGVANVYSMQLYQTAVRGMTSYSIITVHAPFVHPITQHRARVVFLVTVMYLPCRDQWFAVNKCRVLFPQRSACLPCKSAHRPVAVAPIPFLLDPSLQIDSHPHLTPASAVT